MTEAFNVLKKGLKYCLLQNMQKYLVPVSDHEKFSSGGTNDLVDSLVTELNSSNGRHINTVICPFEFEKLPRNPYSKIWQGSAIDSPCPGTFHPLMMIVSFQQKKT